jgi:hypothetical protein
MNVENQCICFNLAVDSLQITLVYGPLNLFGFLQTWSVAAGVEQIIDHSCGSVNGFDTSS